MLFGILLSSNTWCVRKRLSQHVFFFCCCLYFLQAVAKMVQECYKYVDAVSDLTVKLRLIDTLRTVTAGKVGSPARFHTLK